MLGREAGAATGESADVQPSPRRPALTRERAMNPPPTATQDAPREPARAAQRSHPPARAEAILASQKRRRHRDRRELATQHLTLLLDGITAGDYLTWVHDPEPHTLARELRSVQLQADPLDQRIDVLLTWNGHPPPAQAAATAAGLTLTPETELRTSHH